MCPDVAGLGRAETIEGVRLPVVPMRVLLVEDDWRLTTSLGGSLRAEGYAVDVAETAEDGRWMATEVPYDAIVLDVGLPDGDGIDLCAALRDQGVWAPILILTAHAEIRDRVRGLDSGADDYLAKPFAFDELIARLRALLRRGQVERPAVLVVGRMHLDPATRRVSVAGESLAIAGRALAILELLARRQGQFVTRAEIMEHVWDWAWDGVSNVIDVHISALRATLRSSPGAPVIETVRGTGFLLRPGDGMSLTTIPPHDHPIPPHPVVRADLHAARHPGRDRRLAAGRVEPPRLHGGGLAHPCR